ncbi:MAG: hypothetical protein LBL73_07995 [Synergistaceae bacterium]|nr:hypothetical protein [Synergistaceae bacterium]
MLTSNVDFKSESDYEIHVKDGVVCVLDLKKGNMPVMENIVRIVNEVYGLEDIELYMRLICHDADGFWHGVYVCCGNPIFFALNTADMNEAAEAAKKVNGSVCDL